MILHSLPLYIALSFIPSPEPAAFGEDAPYGHKVVYRYRCFEGARPSWVSPIDTSVGGVSHSVGSTDISGINRGQGFEEMISVDLDGQSEFIRANSPIDTTDDAGTDSFTIQAWFNARSTDGYRALVSNTQGYAGFSLKLLDGKLRGLVRFEDGGGYQNIEIIGSDVSPHTWTYAALRVKKQNGFYELRLFQDGDLVASVDTASDWDGVRQSTEHPMVGAEPSSGVGVDSFFEGRIYAVSVTNYAVGIDNFLENKGVRDASRYFGMVSYHDYLDTTTGPDHRISETIEAYRQVSGDHLPNEAYVQTRYYSPFMNDKYIPQGVASNGVDRIYLSMYWKDEEGFDGSYHCPDSDPPIIIPPSILVEMTTTGELVRVLRLLDETLEQYRGHVGGAAYWSGHIYIPRGDDVLRYDLSDAAGPTFSPGSFANHKFDQDLVGPRYFANDCNLGTNNTSISFLSVSLDHDGTPILWTGQFDGDSYKEIVGFELLCDGTFDKGNPAHVYELPVFDVQGIDSYHASCDEIRFYLSTSWSDNPSKIYDVHYDRGVPQATSTDLILTAPAGMEDLALIGDDLWSISESGAKYYQKRDRVIDASDPCDWDPDTDNNDDWRTKTPWDDLYPFVFSVHIPGSTTGSTCIGTPFCSGGPTGSPCPCDNVGTQGGGCANSRVPPGRFPDEHDHQQRGARLSASGTNSVSADDLTLEASCLTIGPGLYFQGDNAVNSGDGVPFGDGLRCAGGSVVRLEVRFATSNSYTTQSTISVAAKGGVSAGQTKRYQYWYRDSGVSPCNSLFNLTNGFEVTWTP